MRRISPSAEVGMVDTPHLHPSARNEAFKAEDADVVGVLAVRPATDRSNQTVPMTRSKRFD
jgi:hypothetical protein